MDDTRNSKVDRLTTKLIDFHQRRIVNAAPSVDDNDYVIQSQLNDAIALTLLKIVSDVASYPKALVYLSAAPQVVPNGANTVIVFDKVLYDTGSLFVNPGSKLTIQQAGYYLVTSQLTWAGGANGGPRQHNIYKNGVAITQSYDTPAIGTDYTETTSIVVYANIKDYFQLNAWQNSTVNQNVLNGAALTFLCAARLS